MKIKRNEKIWAYAGGGTRAHAFCQLAHPSVPEHFRAMCRKSIEHTGSATLVSQRSVSNDVCQNCLNRVEAVRWAVQTAGDTEEKIEDHARFQADLQATAPEDEAQFLAENAERARRLITTNAQNDTEAEALITSFTYAFPALAESLGVAPRVQLPDVGQVFTRTGVRYTHGYRETYTLWAEVLGVISPFVDVWTNDKHLHGVRFRLDEASDGVSVRTSFHALSLDDFRTNWMDTPYD